MESVPSWISWFRLPGAGVAVLVSLLLPFFSQKTGVPDSSMNSELHMTLMETCDVAVWGLCWCNSFPLKKWCEIGEVTKARVFELRNLRLSSGCSTLLLERGNP